MCYGVFNLTSKYKKSLSMTEVYTDPKVPKSSLYTLNGALKFILLIPLSKPSHTFFYAIYSDSGFSREPVNLSPDPGQRYPEPDNLYPDPVIFYPDPVKIYSDTVNLYPDPVNLYPGPKLCFRINPYLFQAQPLQFSVLGHLKLTLN